VDIRSPRDFGLAHLDGALSLPFSARGMAARAGTLAAGERAVVLIGDDGEKLEAAASQLASAEIAMRGGVRGGPDAWGIDASDLRSVEVVAIPRLVEILGEPGAAVTVLDVREPVEWETGHLPGATLIRLAELRDRLAELDRERWTLAICESGLRSSTAASILQEAGFPRVSNVIDGTAGWRRAGNQLQFPNEG
jgi:hydroxyacylglutathione hydrolase